MTTGGKEGVKATDRAGEQLAVRTTAVEHHHAEAGRFVRLYGEMAGSRFANAFAYGRAKVDRLLEDCFAALPPGARVLDVGCGTGEYVLRATLHGFLASGVEPAEAMRKVAIDKNPTARSWTGWPPRCRSPTPPSISSSASRCCAICMRPTTGRRCARCIAS